MYSSSWVSSETKEAIPQNINFLKASMASEWKQQERVSSSHAAFQFHEQIQIFSQCSESFLFFFLSVSTHSTISRDLCKQLLYSKPIIPHINTLSISFHFKSFTNGKFTFAWRKFEKFIASGKLTWRLFFYWRSLDLEKLKVISFSIYLFGIFIRF